MKYGLRVGVPRSIAILGACCLLSLALGCPNTVQTPAGPVKASKAARLAAALATNLNALEDPGGRPTSIPKTQSGIKTTLPTDT